MVQLLADKTLHGYFPLGLPVSRQTVEKLKLTELVAPRNTPAPPAPYVLRHLAARFNDQLVHAPAGSLPVRSGDLITAGIITDVLRYILSLYCWEQTLGVISKGLDHARRTQDPSVADTPPPAFLELYPPPEVLNRTRTATAYLHQSEGAIPHRELVVGESMLLALSMENPAFKAFRPLYDDTPLRRQTPYPLLVDTLEKFFERQPAFGPLGMPLFDCLRAPMKASPDSLDGQLEYIKKYWGVFLPPELFERLLFATDILREQEAFRHHPQAGEVPVLEFWGSMYRDQFGYPEPERFSPDADWMSNVVMLAKSTYVWLDQLSKKYRRSIRLLSDIPNEELDQLARWGFNGLWLIGIWERSSASQKIKQMMGNPEALPSAYSLYDYEIASDLGGNASYQSLRERCQRRGIRLASDMVPNHMGIYSRWMVQHPHWFMQLPYSPYPNYRFTGPNFSEDPNITIQIEDGYFNHSDAAVVFRRIDNNTGDTRYIYHGNDGTSTPWNDTAQLNFMMAEVREAVIQTILHVARLFPIIRFDAAMTLAKKHFQRLWFPLHGEGGAIPSRAEHSMTRAEFDHVFPAEFWREVVDRVAAEVPDTLLLAEAFWLMEGYFVRTLGMHRVYNSAFMNMLKMEENSKYRQTIKNVLTFSPEVAKRFVNFMNNPDERTAVDQFGRGDKYFGVAMMMVTMPGLPMFGHGQVEGFTEKYGMEYRRAYWDEQVDEEMVRRHEREIFPLMRKRYLFSGADNFALYDFEVPGGWVDENVFAYSNRAHGERALILYNNAYNTAHGRIHTSTEINLGRGDDVRMVRRTLTEALALNTDGLHYYIFRDYQTGLEHIRNGHTLSQEGFWTKLHAYQYHAFLDWREVFDSDGSWAEMERRLGGNGVHNMNEAYREMKYEPLLNPFKHALRTALRLRREKHIVEALPYVEEAVNSMLGAMSDYTGRFTDRKTFVESVITDLRLTLIPQEEVEPVHDGTEAVEEKQAIPPADGDIDVAHALIAWSIVRHIGRFGADTIQEIQRLTLERIGEWRLVPAMSSVFTEQTQDYRAARDQALLAWILVAYNHVLSVDDKVRPVLLKQLLSTEAAREFLRVNEYNRALWFNQEQFEKMMRAMLLAASARQRVTDATTVSTVPVATVETNATMLIAYAEASGYQVQRFVDLLKGPGAPEEEAPDRTEPDEDRSRNPEPDKGNSEV